MDSRVKRVVIDMVGDDQPAADQWPCVATPQAPIEKMILIAPQVRTSEGALQSFHIFSQYFNLHIVAEDFAEILNGSPHARLTLVGLEYAVDHGEGFEKLLRDQLFTSQLEGVEYKKTRAITGADELGPRRGPPWPAQSQGSRSTRVRGRLSRSWPSSRTSPGRSTS